MDADSLQNASRNCSAGTPCKEPTQSSAIHRHAQGSAQAQRENRIAIGEVAAKVGEAESQVTDGGVDLRKKLQQQACVFGAHLATLRAHKGKQLLVNVELTDKHSLDSLEHRQRVVSRVSRHAHFVVSDEERRGTKNRLGAQPRCA